MWYTFQLIYTIITIDEFLVMQDKLKVHKLTQSKTIKQNKFWLKGHLMDKHGKRMTASSPMGRTKRYDYYHTGGKGGKNIPMDVAHKMVVNLFKNIKLKSGVISYLEEKVPTYIDKQFRAKKVKKGVLEEQIKKAEVRIKELNKLFALGELSLSEFKELKHIVESQLEENYIALDELIKLPIVTKGLFRQIIDFLNNLDKIFKLQDIKGKSVLVGSLFPNGIFLNLESGRVGTTYINNSILNLIDIERLTPFLEIRKGQPITSCPSGVTNGKHPQKPIILPFYKSTIYKLLFP